MSFRLALLGGCLSALLLYGAPVQAAQIFVAPAGHGTGTPAAPFGSVQRAIDAAYPGDVIEVAPGTYVETLATVRAGTPSQPVLIRASGGRGSVLITSRGRVLTVTHARLTVDGFVLDGQYGPQDIIKVATSANGFTLRNTEVRRTTADAIDMGGPDDVLIENCLIHHALNAAGGRTDAHGIAAAAVHRLTIRNTEIHTFSGDGIQVDPDRLAPGWNDVIIEGCRLWLAPLPAAENGFPAGTVPGENAVDTKSSGTFPRARLMIRDTEAWGFRGGISNMAAFNLKENIDAVLDGVTVYDSEIALRLRGPGGKPAGARVRVQNAVVYNVAIAVRYEDNIEDLRIWNSTFGNGVIQPFHAASSSGSVLDVRNVLVLGTALPTEARGATNRAVAAAAFVNTAAHNYQLASGSPAIDTGAAIGEVTRDRLGVARPQGRAYDVGAYERPSLSDRN